MESVVRQGHVAKIIRELCGEARAAQGKPNAAADLVSIAGCYAWALYNDLDSSTHKPIVSQAMEERRGVPTDPGYFDSLEPIEEFLDVLGDLGTEHDKVS